MNLDSAIQVLTNALEVVENNEPINRAKGDADSLAQADLQARNAVQFREAIKILNAHDPIDLVDNIGRQLSVGEQRIRVNQYSKVDNELDMGVMHIKKDAAELINVINDNGQDPRLTERAITTVEEAAMWAVKSATA